MARVGLAGNAGRLVLEGIKYSCVTMKWWPGSPHRPSGTLAAARAPSSLSGCMDVRCWILHSGTIGKGQHGEAAAPLNRPLFWQGAVISCVRLPPTMNTGPLLCLCHIYCGCFIIYGVGGCLFMWDVFLAPGWKSNSSQCCISGHERAIYARCSRNFYSSDSPK